MLTREKLKNSKKLRAGFTLLETIVSIALLSTTLVLFIDAVHFSLRALDSSERKYTAIKIAQEGMELFISKRNNNVLCLDNASTCTDATNWQDGLVPLNNHYFEIDASSPIKLLAGGNGTHQLTSQTNPQFTTRSTICYDNANFNRFIYCSNPSNSNIQSSPHRKIDVTRIDAEKLDVKSVVTWIDREGHAQSVTLQKILFNTQP